MVRPKKPRIMQGCPQAVFFKPQGIPLRLLEETTILPDEFEAIRLYDVLEYDQKQAAAAMNISQPTFARLIQRAHQKVGAALIFGKAIKIEKNSE